MTADETKPIETPLIMAISEPLKLIAKDENDSWNPTIEDINGGTYDYLKLNRVSGFIDGMVAPYTILVGFDGSLALPSLPEFKQHGKALKIFNRVFLEMLLGGIYSHAVAPADIGSGVLYSTGYIRMFSRAGAVTKLHSSLRERSASASDAFCLMDQKPITISELEAAIGRGREIVEKCGSLSHEIVLSGCTHYVEGALAEALTGLWTSIEQLVSLIWRNEVEAKAAADGVPNRKSFLNDYRVWTTSARIEVLFQKGILNAELYCCLNTARKARNDFIHRGDQPDLVDATAALSGLFYLMSACTSNYVDIHRLDDVRAKIEARCVLRPRPNGPIPESAVKYWREIPQLPGEKNFKGEYAPFPLQFQPIEDFDPKRSRKSAHQSPRRGKTPSIPGD
ncbi:hypothetical protein [Stenotrophomonas pigmentata]|uniref:hypothetical protein n=1 Tax=Stenotrophomonas pigmentata TaxID=3055080 RepID=UPI0026EC9685|nr:hypothetical protein [Stenotrophomonas sp. 610A2]